MALLSTLLSLVPLGLSFAPGGQVLSPLSAVGLGALRGQGLLGSALPVAVGLGLEKLGLPGGAQKPTSSNLSSQFTPSVSGVISGTKEALDPLTELAIRNNLTIAGMLNDPLSRFAITSQLGLLRNLLQGGV